MNKTTFQQLLDSDQLMQAVDVLIAENTSSKTARSLRGRLIELEKQNNMGTISSEAYTIEKNRIRSSLFEIMLGEPESDKAAHSNGGISRKWLIIALVGLLLAIGFFYVLTTKKTKHAATDAPRTTIESTQEEVFEGKNKQQIAEELQERLKKKPLGFESELLSMSEEVEYKQFVATLVRRYRWKVGFPVTIAMSGLQMKWDEPKNKFLVTIPKLKLGNRFSIGDKSVKTIQNIAWIEETSKDGSFWQKVETVTRSKMKPEVFDNKKFTDRLRSQATTLVLSEINQLLDGTGIEDHQVEVVIVEVGY